MNIQILGNIFADSLPRNRISEPFCSLPPFTVCAAFAVFCNAKKVKKVNKCEYNYKYNIQHIDSHIILPSSANCSINPLQR